jgi:hypothetical protein
MKPYSLSTIDEYNPLCSFLIIVSQFLSSTETGETWSVCCPGGKVFLSVTTDPSLSIVLGQFFSPPTTPHICYIAYVNVMQLYCITVLLRVVMYIDLKLKHKV